jgi:protein-S-isoprenylcysteine O-methyltransferase Ste14
MLISHHTSALVIRASAVAWFLFLSVISFTTINRLLAETTAGRTDAVIWPTLASEICVALFYTLICCIMLLRPEPVSRAEGFWPALLALAGSYGTWLIPLLPRGPDSPALAALSAAILVVSELLIIYTLLSLGRSFSLTPQARKLVTNGPYAIVRHPLYLVEEAAVVGILLQYAWFAALPFLILHLTLQLRRMKLEEAILAKSFPEYTVYARRTARLIPGLW